MANILLISNHDIQVYQMSTLYEQNMDNKIAKCGKNRCIPSVPKMTYLQP